MWAFNEDTLQWEVQKTAPLLLAGSPTMDTLQEQ